MPAKVTGALALRKALQKYEPELAKETQREIASALKPIVAKARGFLPSNEAVPSGWLKIDGAQGKWATRYYDKSEASRGITYKTTPSKPNSKGFRAVASILNKSAGGSIYETAGRKTSGQQGNSTNPRAGQQFIAALGGTSNIVNADSAKRAGRHSNKQRGRAMFRAVAEDQGKARAAVMKAIENAANKFNRRTQ
jgi:hypothetical protein